ncbi:MAG: hypothetical protein KDA79_04165 [Planctomycetaceae bacterium]|nr:hypothetical protein [Planctomycetaceae bacterium]
MTEEHAPESGSDENPENGESAGQDFTIDRIDMGPGWVCFQVGEHPPPIEQLPAALNHCFCTWLQRNSEFQVRTTLPIVERGCTVAMHIWFD